MSDKKFDMEPELANQEKATFEDTRFGMLTEGVNEVNNQQVNVQVVSRRSVNADYKVGGVLDQEHNNNWKAWLYLAPVLILMAVFLIFPLINTILIAFMKGYSYVDGSFDAWTFDNFLVVTGIKGVEAGGGIAFEKNFIQYAIPNTLIVVFVTVPLSIMIALLISVLLNNIRWLQKTYQIVFFLPYVTNAIAIGMVFSVMFDKHGLINYLFNSQIDWIYGGNRWLSMIPLCIYIVWSSLPFKILILLSGLQNVDKQYYQAAKIDAAPQWKVLTRITVPALSPQILYLMVTSFIGAFKEYTAVVGLFGQKAPDNLKTVVFYIYDNLNTNTERAAAAAVILFIIILLFTFLQLWLSKKKVQY